MNSEVKGPDPLVSNNIVVNLAPAGREKRSFQKKCEHFWCRKPWFSVLLILSIVGLLACLIFFVTLPEISRRKFNDAELKVQGISILETTPDSFQMQVNSTIHTRGSSKAVVYGFPSDMYLKDLAHSTPFARLDFPDMEINNRSQPINITQNIIIEKPDAFGSFSEWFFNNETLRIAMEGHARVKLRHIHIKARVHFNKILEYKGLNRLAGLQIQDGHMSTDSGVPYNFNATASIPNASIFTLNLGNMTFVSFLNNTRIGNVTIENVTLRPGENLLPLKANMNQTAIISAAARGGFCPSGIVPLKLLGTDVINDGKHLDYFQRAISSTNLTVHLDMRAMLEKDLHTKLACPTPRASARP